MKMYLFWTILLIGSASSMFIIWMWSFRRSGKKFWNLIFPTERQKNSPQENIIGPAQHVAANDAPVMPQPGAAEPTLGHSQLHPEPEVKQPRRDPYRPRKQKEERLGYRDIFLVNDGARARLSTYINRDVHEKFKRLLSIVAPDVTISSFINNILNHHLEQFRDEIYEMYHNEFDKPF